MFIVPADTFDNVAGKFPIGFKIWNTDKKEKFVEIISDVYDKNGDLLEKKGFYSYEGLKYYSKWVNSIKTNSELSIGWLQGVTRNDFQTQDGIDIRNQKNQYAFPRGIEIYDNNLIECSICYAVRMSISANWLNDRDQFLFPNDGWHKDSDFQNNCFAYTLFSNTIQSKFGINHWIPFNETEINAKEKFESNFMTMFIQGTIKTDSKIDLFGDISLKRNTPLIFSQEAKAVFDAGRELWKYYHTKSNIDVNASLYDIREFFQGRNTKGKMNNKSDDTTYMQLIIGLRSNLRSLADVISPKVFEYGFLKQ
jgi:hypothetical protein